MNREKERILETAAKKVHWRRWGPYLADRQWGTVREDYSQDGDAWSFVSHAMAPAYAYRWGEDGLGGISDNHQRLCFGLALWNGQDPILKERLFGLTNPQGNHGEDVKEYYWHLDSTPTHSYMSFLYRYPQQEFPYALLIEENASRSRHEREFELLDTGVFAGNRFFDARIEYAKNTHEDILIQIRVTNRAPVAAPLWLIPQLWFRNDWSWKPRAPAPLVSKQGNRSLRMHHRTLGTRFLGFSGDPDVRFTENLSNLKKLYGADNPSPYCKDAFHRYLIDGEKAVVKSESGTKAGLFYSLQLPPREEIVIRLRLSDGESHLALNAGDFDQVFEDRRREADEFYADLAPAHASPQTKAIQRRAFAGLLWSKQWYHYVVEDWLQGDPAQPPPPPSRLKGRNANWLHLYNDDVLCMPDAWEYPWYAVWDSAFHAIAEAAIDPDHAKRQLQRFTREWYMHPNGQLPAYEWNFADVNPPVHAWACYRVYKIDEKHFSGKADRAFLERVFHKLLMNFTWWVNRKDYLGRNLFQGGFLGMDNIGVFDRSATLPAGGHLLQSDGTSWMAMFCLNMLRISWELAQENHNYEDIASKFYEHFLSIAAALSSGTPECPSLWHEEDGFFYDYLSLPGQDPIPLRVRSMVGLVPLFAVEILDYRRLERTPGFKRRMEWFLEHRPDMARNICCLFNPGGDQKCILSALLPDQLTRILQVMLDENEFLSPYGIRSLSKYHQENPYSFEGGDVVRYEPGESSGEMFGGNSNWRGPIWFPMNFLIIESLSKFHYFWGDQFKVEFPTGSGQELTLGEVAQELSRRLISTFQRRDDRRPVFGQNRTFQEDPLWRDEFLFYEYFDGDTGEGLGASHQTGWTSLVAKLIMQSG